MYYYIKINCRDDFCRIDEMGRVVESKNGKILPSDNWKITGAWYQKPFGHIGFISLADLLSMRGNPISDFKYKNGVPKMGLTDIDHGTARMWGNKAAHGIAYIVAEE